MSNTFKVIIAGGKDFNNQPMMQGELLRVLRRINAEGKDIELVCSEERGANQLGKRWAEYEKHKITVFKSNYEGYGNYADLKRIMTMAEYADCLVAFYDGVDSDTSYMIQTARDLKLKTEVILYGMTPRTNNELKAEYRLATPLDF